MSKLHNPWGMACICLLVLFFPVTGILVSIANRIHARRLLRQQQMQRIMGPGQSYRPIDHVHEIDYHRSGPVVTDAGAIFARCCIAGCEEGVFIGSNVAAAWKMPNPEPIPVSVLMCGQSGW
jgi:hypothetical protein